MRPRARIAAAALTVALACGGCGLGPGAGTRQVDLTVTRGFGAQRVKTVSAGKVPGSETVMRMLQRSFTVHTRYGGGYVESIDGYAGSGAHLDWFYYVNGVQARQGAATTSVHKGDRIWWDLHDWRATNSVRAVVGSFPEPFVHGVSGKRLPTTLQCGHGLSAACTSVRAAFTAIHVPLSSQLFGAGSGTDTLGVVVGTWPEIRSTIAGQLIAKGPAASGVYARFTADDRLALLDPAGRVARTLGAGAGLIAATADSSSVPTWIITGTDAAGVRAAARELTSRALHDHFALAVQGTSRMPVPIDGTR